MCSMLPEFVAARRSRAAIGSNLFHVWLVLMAWHNSLADLVRGVSARLVFVFCRAGVLKLAEK